MNFLLNSWVKIIDSASWADRDSFHAVVANGYIYISGGSIAGGVRSAEVWRSADGINWTLLTAAPGWAARAAHGFLFYDNKFWVFGGSTAVAMLNDVWSSVDGTTWVQVTASAAWASRHQFGFCIHNNKMYISGGYNISGDTYYSSVYSSTDGAAWTLETANFGIAIRQHGMISFLGNLWIICGNNSSSSNYSDIRRSLDNGATWSNLGLAACGPRKEIKLIKNEEETQLAIMAGRNQISIFRDVWVTTNGTLFTQITQLVTRPSSRDAFAIARINNNTFIMGGSFGSNLFNEVYKESYTVVYNANGGSSPPTDTTYYNPGDVATVANIGAMNRGVAYTFNNWNTVANGSGTSYDPGDTFAIALGVNTLYAQWNMVPLSGIFYAEAIGGNEYPYDTREKAATNLSEIFNNVPSVAWVPEWGIIYVFGMIYEPNEWNSFTSQGSKIIGEDPQTTKINMNTCYFEECSLYNITFIADNIEAEWNTLAYQPSEAINCIFIGNEIWYRALETYASTFVKFVGNSFEGFLGDAVYISIDGLSPSDDVLLINNSLSNGNMYIEVSNSTINNMHLYNNAMKNATFHLEIINMVMTEFLHDHNISTEAYEYFLDGNPLTPDITEIIADPLYLETDPNNRLAIDDTSPCYHAGIKRSTSPLEDLMGELFSDPPSIGAYEIPITLQADFVGSPIIGNADLVVQFIDTSLGEPTSWIWNFGDGTISLEQNPIHTYSLPGSYTVILVVYVGINSSISVKEYYINVYTEIVGSGFVRDKGPSLIFD